MNPLAVRLVGLFVAVCLVRGGIVSDPVGGPAIPLSALALQAAASLAALLTCRRADVFAIRYLLGGLLLGLTGAAIWAVVTAVPPGAALWSTLAAQLIVFRGTLGLLADVIHERRSLRRV